MILRLVRSVRCNGDTRRVRQAHNHARERTNHFALKAGRFHLFAIKIRYAESVSQTILWVQCSHLMMHKVLKRFMFTMSLFRFVAVADASQHGRNQPPYPKTKPKKKKCSEDCFTHVYVQSKERRRKKKQKEIHSRFMGAR